MTLRQLGGAELWRVEAEPGQLAFAATEGQHAERLAGDALAAALAISHSMGAKPLLSVRLSIGKLVLVLTETDVQTLVRVAGPPLVTRAAVATHGLWDVAVGALMITSNLQPDTDAIDPTPRSLQLAWMGLGALAVLIGVGAKLRPHRVLLALDAVWMAALVAYALHQLVFGSFGLLWMLVMALVPIAYGRLRMFSLLAHPDRAEAVTEPSMSDDVDEES